MNRMLMHTKGRLETLVFLGAELDDARHTVVVEMEAAIEAVRQDRESSNG